MQKTKIEEMPETKGTREDEDEREIEKDTMTTDHLDAEEMGTDMIDEHDLALAQERGRIEVIGTGVTGMNAGGMTVRTGTDQVDEGAELQTADAVAIHLLAAVAPALPLDDQGLTRNDRQTLAWIQTRMTFGQKRWHPCSREKIK